MEAKPYPTCPPSPSVSCPTAPSTPSYSEAAATPGQRSQSSRHRHHHRNRSSQQRGWSKGHHQRKGNAQQQKASDISSPDLGVDVSSDPFSSLERARGYLSESLKRGTPPHGTPDAQPPAPPVRVDSMVVENRQLRQERDLLMQKLVRSKGALKETLDRLATSPVGSRPQSLSSRHRQQQQQKEAGGYSSSSPAAAAARARTTQELVEFSRSHKGSSATRGKGTEGGSEGDKR